MTANRATRVRLTGPEWVAFAVLAATVVIAALDYAVSHFGADIMSDSRILSICLSTVALLALYVVFDTAKQRAAIAEVEQRLSEMSASKIADERFAEDLLRPIDPKLRPMFAKHLSPLLAEIESAYETQTVQFTDPDRFKMYYLAVLQAFPANAALRATSLPLERYFWDGVIEARMGEFVRRRGRAGVRFRRLFYTSAAAVADPTHLSAEEHRVLSRQLAQDIDVYLCACDCLPTRMVLVDGEDVEDATIAWVVNTDAEFRIVKVTATSKARDVQQHHDEVMHEFGKAVRVRAVNGRIERAPTP